jgi:hypothetical protein
MSDKKDYSSVIFPVLIISIIIIILAALFYSFFEIEQRTERGAHSEEAKKNVYLALDRWLSETGHPLEIYQYGDAETIEESGKKSSMIFASSYDWSSSGKLKEFILYDKNNVVLFIDTYDEDEDLETFLLDFDIEYRLYSPWEESDVEYDEDEFTFDEDVYFRIKDTAIQTRIQKITVDENVLIVCGIPLFMQSGNIDKQDNALLAWSISGALDKEKSGFAVFRSNEAAENKTPFYSEGGGAGVLFLENKASLLLILSVLALIIIGFSQSILTFGKWEPERALPGKSIKERLLSEARFLKKHRALGLYTKELYGDNSGAPVSKLK